MKSIKRLTFLVVVLFILATGSIAAFQSTPKAIALIDDGKVTQFETAEVYVGELLAARGIELTDKDEVTPSLDTKIENGTKITVKRWKETVNLTLNGEDLVVRTAATSVDEFLSSRSIPAGKGTEVTPELTTPITSDMEIVVKTTEVVTETITEEIPYTTEVKYTTDLAPGEEQVITTGQSGLKEKTVEIVRLGGEVVEETVQEEMVLQAPVIETKLVGKKNIIEDAYSGKMYEYTKVLTMNATAYHHGPDDPWYNKTASGLPTFRGVVAVDRNVIPLGTILYVEGYGIAIAADVGGAIKGNKIDLYKDSYSEARAFGRQTKTVYILQEQDINVRQVRASLY